MEKVPDIELFSNDSRKSSKRTRPLSHQDFQHSQPSSSTSQLPSHHSHIHSQSTPFQKHNYYSEALNILNKSHLLSNPHFYSAFKPTESLKRFQKKNQNDNLQTQLRHKKAIQEQSAQINRIHQPHFGHQPQVVFHHQPLPQVVSRNIISILPQNNGQFQQRFNNFQSRQNQTPKMLEKGQHLNKTLAFPQPGMVQNNCSEMNKSVQKINGLNFQSNQRHSGLDSNKAVSFKSENAISVSKKLLDQINQESEMTQISYRGLVNEEQSLRRMQSEKGLLRSIENMMEGQQKSIKELSSRRMMKTSVEPRLLDAAIKACEKRLPDWESIKDKKEEWNQSERQEILFEELVQMKENSIRMGHDCLKDLDYLLSKFDAPNINQTLTRSRSTKIFVLSAAINQ